MKGYSLLLVVIFSACANKPYKVTGTYQSTCYINMYPNVILTLRGSNTFSYKFAYLDEPIEGTWFMHKDTVFLTSSSFNEPKDSLTPKVKNTEFKGMDV